MEKVAPAPWNLTGNAYIMFFKFPKQFIMEHGFLDERFQKGFFGNVGCIIIADYQSSIVGPYQELLFLPGKMRYHHRKLYTISKNFVSTTASLENGRENWGISRELAFFKLTCESKDVENIKVSREGTPIIDITFRTGAGFPIPVNTLFLPVPLVQIYDGKLFRFNFHGKGFGKFSQILKVDVNPELFPNFAFFKHVVIMRVSNFQVRFPVAKVSEGKR